MSAVATSRLSSNLSAAQRAGAIAISLLSHGSSNKAEDMLASFGQNAFCVGGVRDQFRSVNAKLSAHDALRAMARFATAAKCGNCQEHAVVAFLELKKLGLENVEVWHFTNADHAFAVIDREDSTTQLDPTTWGKNSVVCDAWGDKYYPAIELSRRYPGKRLGLYYQGD